MWRLTRAWPSLFVVLVLASGCGRGSPTSPSTPFGSDFLACRAPTFGAMTATLDGTPWIPVSTGASVHGPEIWLGASDCKYYLWIRIFGFKGLGTYDVAAGGVDGDLVCDGQLCGRWVADVTTDVFGKTTVRGSGSLTVTAYTAPTPGVVGSGAIEGTFSFTLLSNSPGATATRVMSNGHFGSRFSGL